MATTCAADIASVRFAGSVNPVAVSLAGLLDSDF